MAKTTTKKTVVAMNTSDKDTLLNKYTRSQYPALVKSAPVETVQPDENEEIGYRALVEHREKKGNAPRFRIIDRRGQSYGCGYAYLLGWMYSPPETLSIYTTTHSFILTGKNLGKIEDALMRERVKQLREFNPAQDELPAQGEPVIDRLEINSRFETV